MGQQKIGAAAGDDKLPVIIAITAASVIITATIAVPASTTAAAVKASLSSTLSTADAASSALGITIEGVPTITIASSTLDGEPDDLPGASTSNTGVIAGGILGASAFVCLVLVVARKMFMVRRQKDITVLFSELKPKRAVTAPEQKVKEWEMGAQNRA